jgi:hypothetical protein
MVATIVVVLSVVSCTEQPQPTPTPTPSPGRLRGLSGINRWIYDRLYTWYYWDEALQAADVPDRALPYNQFLTALVRNAYNAGAQDAYDTPPTIDGFYLNGTRRFYSNIVRTGGTMTRTGSFEVTFGFSVRPVQVSPTQYYLVVTLVNAGSPAAAAGMTRGVKITKYAGQDINSSILIEFQRVLMLASGAMPTLTDSNGRTYNLTPAIVEVTPIIHHSVVTSPRGTKVAYLVYNRFIRGSGGDPEDFEYDNELISIFREFKAAGATELVLDLRYNGGGDISCCQLLASLIGRVTTDMVFGQLLRNENIHNVYPADNPEVFYFRQDGIDNGLGLTRLYVLGTLRTASASEMIVSSLRGALGDPGRGLDDPSVFLIGATTNGKNVGMDVLTATIGGFNYEMAAITFKILNSNDFSNYAGGFAPNMAVNELQAVVDNPAAGVIYDFGNPSERLLAAALSRIDGTAPVTPFASAAPVAPSATDGSAVEMDWDYDEMYDPRRDGLRYYHD